MKFNTRENRIKTPPEINGGPTLVESAGYQTRTQKVTSYMQAGARLTAVRSEMYDYYDDENIEDMVVDPTRRKNFDIAEASQMMRDLNDRIRAQNAGREKEPAPVPVTEPVVKGSQTASEAPAGA